MFCHYFCACGQKYRQNNLFFIMFSRVKARDNFFKSSMWFYLFFNDRHFVTNKNP